MSNEQEETLLFLEPFSGISGDMFLASLLDLGLDREWLEERINSLLPGSTNLKIWESQRGEISGTRFALETGGEEETRHLTDLLDLVESSQLGEPIKEKSKEMFILLAEVEAGVHGVSREEIHFHEVGALDSIADVVGAAAAIWKLSPDSVYSDPVNVGTGRVSTAHGELPLPAPATADLLRRGGVPTYSTGVEEELTTPTGALILASFVDFFERPSMTVESIGRGLGSRQIGAGANYLRASLGRRTTVEEGGSKGEKAHEIMIETNIDDMNPELFPVVEDKLLEAGALDVFKTPIQMKKNRPGVRLTVICSERKKKELSELIFRETSTLGLRVQKLDREKLEREIRTVETDLGSVRIKIGYLDGDPVTLSPEFDSCHNLAEETGRSVKEVIRKGLSAASEEFDLKA